MILTLSLSTTSNPRIINIIRNIKIQYWNIGTYTYYQSSYFCEEKHLVDNDDENEINSSNL